MKRSEIMAIIANKEQTDKEIVDAIMSLHGTDAEMWKATKAELEQEIASGKTELSDAQKSFDDYKAGDDPNEWETKYNAEVDAHKATKKAHAEKEDRDDTTALLRAAFTSEKANPKAIDLFLNTVNHASVKKKDGKITNWDDIAKPIKEQYAEFFGEVKKEAAPVWTPPGKQPDAPKVNLTAALFGTKQE